MIELTSETSDPKQRNNSQIICFLKKEKEKNNTMSKLLSPSAAIKQLGNCPLGHSRLFLTSLNNPVALSTREAVVLPYPVFGLVGRSEAPLLTQTCGLICVCRLPESTYLKIFFLQGRRVVPGGLCGVCALLGREKKRATACVSGLDHRTR
jgi:hypothetical protein